MDFIGKITAEIIIEDGVEIPTFIFNTKNLNKTYEIFKNFYVTPLPINISSMKKLSPKQNKHLPDNKPLKVELAFEDPYPFNAFGIFLSENDIIKLGNANKISRRIRFAFREKRGFLGKSKTLILHDLYPYIMDWHGVLGVYSLFRLNGQIKELNSESENNFTTNIKNHLEQCGYATGLYTEMGMMHRLANNFEKAEECYIKEIQNCLDENGIPTLSSARAINNLAVLYKKQQKIEESIELFLASLFLNNNFFESLLGITGLLNDIDLSLKCIAKAYRIRPYDKNIQSALELASNFYKKSIDEINKKFKEKLEEINISTEIKELKINNLNFINKKYRVCK